MACNVVVDPEFESLIPPLAEDELRGLEESILADGVRDALVVWREHGILLDGHNRKRICDKHSVDYPVKEITLEDRKAARVWIRNNQMARRNLNAAQKLELQFQNKDELLAMGKEKREATQGRPHKEKLLSDTDNSFKEPKHDTRQQIAAAAGVATGTVAMAEVVRKESPELWDKAKAGDITINKAYTTHSKDKKEKERKQKRKEIAESVKVLPKNDRYKIFQADIKTVILDRQYDFIITDPPYPKEYLPLYETLAMRANEWLSPNGLLIAMAGQSYLDQIYSMMQKHLEYYWTACYFTPGQPTPLRQVNVNCSWKPLLIFRRKGDKYKGKIFGDVFRSDQNEKQHHDWGQSESGIFDIVSKICLPGQSILDPFLGGGTTGVAAVRHGCYFEGFDILEENAKIAAARVEQ